MFGRFLENERPCTHHGYQPEYLLTYLPVLKTSKNQFWHNVTMVLKNMKQPKNRLSTRVSPHFPANSQKFKEPVIGPSLSFLTASFVPLMFLADGKLGGDSSVADFEEVWS